jgi:hypothetical protein
MRKALLALCAISSFYAPVTATAYTGNQLLPECETTNVSYCLGEISGFRLGFGFVMNRWQVEPKLMCVPDGVSNGQLRDIVIQYIRENPQTRHESAQFLIVWSLEKAFPCGSRR